MTLTKRAVAVVAVVGLAPVVGLLLALRALWRARAVAASLTRSLAAEVAARLGAEAAAEALRRSAIEERQRRDAIAEEARRARDGVAAAERKRRLDIDRAAELGVAELAVWFDRAFGSE